MIIKTFTDESSAAALKRIRKEMGGDAVVLKTRQVAGRDKKTMFEVTACLEKASVARTSEILTDTDTAAGNSPVSQPEPKPQPVREIEPSTRTDTDYLREKIVAIDRKLNQLLSLGIQPDGISRLEMFQKIHRCLKEADLPDDYLEAFISSVTENYDGISDITAVTRQKLAGELEGMIARDVTLDHGDTAVFIGPAGSGKSSVMGKLAASLVAKQRRSVRLLTLDNFKMGAFDEICSYAEILGIEVIDPLKLDTEKASDKDAVTLIDAPAMPFNAEKLKALRSRIEQINPTHTFAVFSFLTRSRDVFEISKRLKELRPTHLVVTMQDLASCYGTAITAVKSTGLKMAFISDAPGGMDDLKSPDPDYLAGMLLGSEVNCE
ncbi:MAG: hypothetical protein AB1483_09305 [Candidatus Zixiibacteriota bacterium]